MSSRVGICGGSSIARGRLKERARDFGRSVKTTSAIIFGLVDFGVLAREDEEVLAWVNEVIAADVKIKRSVRVSRAAVTAFEEVDIRCRKKILGR